MHWIDLIIIGVIALSAIIGLLRGFITEALSLAIWVAAFWVAWFFFRPLGDQFTPWIDVQSVRFAIAFGLLLLIVLLFGGVVSYFMKVLVHSTGLDGTDRLLGVFFGAMRGAVVIGILVLLAGLTPLPQDQWWHDSALIPYFEDLAVWMRSLLPPDIADHFTY